MAAWVQLLLLLSVYSVVNSIQFNSIYTINSKSTYYTETRQTTIHSIKPLYVTLQSKQSTRVPYILYPTIPIYSTLLNYTFQLHNTSTLPSWCQYVAGQSDDNYNQFSVTLTSSAPTDSIPALTLEFISTVYYVTTANQVVHYGTGTVDKGLQGAGVEFINMHTDNRLYDDIDVVIEQQSIKLLVKLIVSDMNNIHDNQAHMNITLNDQNARIQYRNTGGQLGTTRARFNSNNDILLSCESGCGLCTNIISSNGFDINYNCVFESNSNLQLSAGTLHIGSSFYILGGLYILYGTHLIIDIGRSNVGIIECRDYNNILHSIINHGRISIVSGTIIINSPLQGIGTLEIGENAIVELNFDVDTLISFNRTGSDDQSIQPSISDTIPSNTGNNDESSIDALLHGDNTIQTIQRYIIQNSGTLILQRGRCQLMGAVSSSAVGVGALNKFIVSPYTYIELNQYVDTTQSNTELPVAHLFTGELFMNYGIIDISNSQVHIETTLYGSYGLINITLGGHLELALTDRDSNIMSGIPVLAAWNTQTTNSAINKNDSTTTVQNFDLVSSNKYINYEQISVGLINGGVLLVQSGTIRIIDCYISYNSYVTISRSAELVLQYDMDNSMAHPFMQSIPLSNNVSIPVPTYYFNGNELINHGRITLMSGTLCISVPIQQNIDGQIRLQSDQSTLIFATSNDDTNTTMNIFGGCGVSVGGVDCASIDAHTNSHVIILSGHINTVDRTALSMGQLVNHGTLILNSYCTLQTNSMTQTNINSLLSLNTNSSWINSGIDPCRLTGGLLINGTNLNCSIQLNESHLIISDQTSILYGDLITTPNTQTTFVYHDRLINNTLLNVAGNVQLAGNLKYTGSLHASNNNSIVDVNLIYSTLNITGRWIDTTSNQLIDNMYWLLHTNYMTQSSALHAVHTNQPIKDASNKHNGAVPCELHAITLIAIVFVMCTLF